MGVSNGVVAGVMGCVGGGTGGVCGGVGAGGPVDGGVCTELGLAAGGLSVAGELPGTDEIFPEAAGKIGGARLLRDGVFATGVNGFGE